MHLPSTQAATKSAEREISPEVRRELPAEAAELYIFTGGLGLSWRGLARYVRKKSEQASASPARIKLGTASARTASTISGTAAVTSLR